MQWTNLDMECARAAEAALGRVPTAEKQELEKLCADAASVSVENGPYALFLFLQLKGSKDREKKERERSANAILQAADQLVRRFVLGKPAPEGPLSDAPIDAILQRMADLSADLNRLLLAKKLILRMLTYARYHAKAREKPAATVAAGGN